MSALRKNVASQVLTFNAVNATTGAALTGATVTTKVTLDGTQSASAGTLTELGTGQYKYVPTQGETNGTSVGFSFTATNMIPVNLHCFTTAGDPTDAAGGGLSRLDAAVTTRMATYTQPTGFLAATFPTGTVANTTNITSATGITVSTNSDKTGYSLTQTFPTNFSAMAITAGGVVSASGNWSIAGDAMTLTAAYNAAKTASQLVATDIVSGGAITTSAGIASADIKKVNAVTVNGNGAGTPWGP